MRSAALRNCAVAEESSAGLGGGESSAPRVMTSTSELLRRIGSRCVTVDASASASSLPVAARRRRRRWGLSNPRLHPALTQLKGSIKLSWVLGCAAPDVADASGPISGGAVPYGACASPGRMAVGNDDYNRRRGRATDGGNNVMLALPLPPFPFPFSYEVRALRLGLPGSDSASLATTPLRCVSPWMHPPSAHSS